MPVADTDITTWLADFTGADSNAPVDGENIGGLLDDVARNIKSVQRAESENKQWVRPGWAPTFVTATSFTLTGDRRTTAVSGRRCKATLTGGVKYGTVASSSFGSSVTTVNVRWDLEEYTPWTRVDNDSLTIAADVATRFASGTVFEFWRSNSTGDVRYVRVVDTAVYSAPDTTITLLTGDPFQNIPATFDSLLVPSEGIDATVSEVEFGAFAPDLYQSGWGHTAIATAFEITANNTAGPFTVALPDVRATNTYTPQVQAVSANTAPSNTLWAMPMVTAVNVANFVVTLPVAIDTGPVMTYDFVILEQA